MVTESVRSNRTLLRLVPHSSVLSLPCFTIEGTYYGRDHDHDSDRCRTHRYRPVQAYEEGDVEKFDALTADITDWQTVAEEAIWKLAQAWFGDTQLQDIVWNKPNLLYFIRQLEPVTSMKAMAEFEFNNYLGLEQEGWSGLSPREHVVSRSETKNRQK